VNAQERTGYSIVLDRPKSAENVGAVLRSAVAFGASCVVLVGARYGKRARTDTVNAAKKLEIVEVDDFGDLEARFEDTSIVVVERGLRSSTGLSGFHHPLGGAYVFGPEDGAVDLNALVVHFPFMAVHIEGASGLVAPELGSLNLATAASIVMYDRISKSFGGKVW
jgi:tRNA(Leu) C34 or U34 (ribose-2'-O)-methylase TrmL